jgi:hypothetical protein
MSNVREHHVHPNSPNCPGRCPLQLKLSRVAHTEILLLVQGDDSSRFGDINPDRTPQGIKFCLLAAGRIVYGFDRHFILGSDRCEVV